MTVPSRSKKTAFFIDYLTPNPLSYVANMNIIKRLLPYLKPYRPTIILTLFLGLCLSGVSLVTAKLVQIIIDAIFVAKNQKMLFVAPAIVVGLYVVSGIIRFIH